MKHENIDAAIIDVLRPLTTGASTKLIANRIFLRETNYFLIHASNDQRALVYRRLCAMQKKGLVMGNGGYWKIVNKTAI